MRMMPRHDRRVVRWRRSAEDHGLGLAKVLDGGRASPKQLDRSVPLESARKSGVREDDFRKLQYWVSVYARWTDRKTAGTRRHSTSSITSSITRRGIHPISSRRLAGSHRSSAVGRSDEVDVG